MIIAVRAILKPRRQHTCATCKGVIEGPHIRMYGAGGEHDPKYVIRVHTACVTRRSMEREPRLAAAVERLVEM